MSNPPPPPPQQQLPESKYQTLTPVPPIPPVGYEHQMGYGHFAAVAQPVNQSYGLPPHGYVYNGEPLAKQMKLEYQQPVENSFQVPSVSSTTRQPVSLHAVPQTHPLLPQPVHQPQQPQPQPQQQHPPPHPHQQQQQQQQQHNQHHMTAPHQQQVVMHQHVHHQQQQVLPPQQQQQHQPPPHPHHHHQQQQQHNQHHMAAPHQQQQAVMHQHVHHQQQQVLPPQQQQQPQQPAPLPSPQQQQQQPAPITNNNDWDHSQTLAGGALSPGDDSSNGNEKSAKKKRKRCGECPGCLKKDNCGDCGPCKSVRSHQICKMRKCDQLKTKKEKARESKNQLSACSDHAGTFPTVKLATAPAQGSTPSITTSMNGSATDTSPSPRNGLRDVPSLSPANGQQDAPSLSPRNGLQDAPSPSPGNRLRDVPSPLINRSIPVLNVLNGSSYTPENAQIQVPGSRTPDANGGIHQLMTDRLKTMIQNRQNLNNKGTSETEYPARIQDEAYCRPASPSAPYASHYGSYSVDYQNGQDMDVECGHTLTQLDSVPSGNTLLDLSNNYDSGDNGNTTVLPPVSTFLLPSAFRESGYWSSNLIEANGEQREYMTSLPASN